VLVFLPNKKKVETTAHQESKRVKSQSKTNKTKKRQRLLLAFKAFQFGGTPLDLTGVNDDEPRF
jgi:hypothetical protein